MTYTVAVDHEVCGKTRGASLSEKDLEGFNVEALLAAGAITSTTNKNAKEAE